MFGSGEGIDDVLQQTLFDGRQGEQEIVLPTIYRGAVPEILASFCCCCHYGLSMLCQSLFKFESLDIVSFEYVILNIHSIR